MKTSFYEGVKSPKEKKTWSSCHEKSSVLKEWKLRA